MKGTPVSLGGWLLKRKSEETVCPPSLLHPKTSFLTNTGIINILFLFIKQWHSEYLDTVYVTNENNKRRTATMETYLMAFVVSFLLLECKQTPHNKEPINVRQKASMQEHWLLTLMNAFNIAIQGSIILVQPHY